nr:hypothetical protein [Tanacetum cinerariifolium]
MGDKHLDTIPKKESDEFIRPSVKNLEPNPKSLLNQDSLIISSFNIDSLLDEFAGELIFLKSIPPGIDEDSDSFMEEIDLFLTLDDSMLSSNENDDYDSEGDILFFEELLSNDSPLPLENKSFHFDVPSSSRPHAKPPDDDEIEPDTGILSAKVVGDISEYYVLIPRLLPTQPTLASNEEKPPHLSSYRGVFETKGPSVSILVSVGCQKPGHLAARLGCAETKVATWDDLTFKLIILGGNVKHRNIATFLKS